MHRTVNENNLRKEDEKDKAPSLDGRERVKPFSGFIILRLSGKYSYFAGDKLEELARKHKLTRLLSILEATKPRIVRRNVKSISLKKLRELEENARRSEFPPLHSVAAYWRLDYRNYDGDLDDLVKRFEELHEVDLAYKEMSVSDPWIDASDDTHADQQGYLDAADEGIDARWAWTQVEFPGAGVGFIDLEQGWIPTHEDLAPAGPSLVFNDNRDGVGAYVGNHGTAVLGQVVAVDNDFGVVGIAPSVDFVRMVSHYEAASDTSLHVADAIVAAITNMNLGDVLLLEVARGDGPELPTETDAADLDAIRLAVGNGIIVVEAGGNGNSFGVPQDLDDWTDTLGRFRLNRTHDDFEDSGAIVVGAARSALPHNRMSWSDFGSRVDCYAWGENIVTTGYGNLAGSGTGTPNDNYKSDFGGTSGASPIIVGAALIVQGMYKTLTGTVLSPLQMRSLLSDPATGTPQGGGVAGNIGVMPNLRAILEGDVLNLVPDIYLRDYVGDDGSVPSTGAISASPDIIVRPELVADPTAEFGEGSGNENSSTLGSVVEFGQDNFIYVRMKNRGGTAANGATADVYWSEVGTLITPDLWNLIGTTDPVDVPEGDILVVTNPLTWDSGTLPPADTHQCFVGILQHARDAGPPPAASLSWDDFYNLIKNHNNVTWRNFDVVDDLDASDPSAALRFNVNGAHDKARQFDLEILRALPKRAQLWLEMPYSLFAVAPIKGIDVKFDRKRKSVSVLLPNLSRLSIRGVNLPKSARYKCRFLLKGGEGYENGLHRVAIRQLYENFEVGRVTFGLRAKARIYDKKKNKRSSVRH